MSADMRRAYLLRVRPLPVFRVRSASGAPSRLVVVQRDLSLSCNCPAAGFGAPDCAHRRIARHSITRRTGYQLPPEGRSGAAAAGIFGVLQGGRDRLSVAWEAAS